MRAYSACKYICKNILHSLFLLLNNGFLLKKNDDSFKKEKGRDALAVSVRAAFIDLEGFRESWDLSLPGWLKLKFGLRVVEALSLRYWESLSWLFLSSLCALVYLKMCKNLHVHYTEATTELSRAVPKMEWLFGLEKSMAGSI